MMAYEQFVAFVANLGRYNEGDMVGDWLPLPYDPDRLVRHPEPTCSTRMACVRYGSAMVVPRRSPWAFSQPTR